MQIEAISAKSFKGQTFDQPIGQKTLFIGKNGIGKSARTQALQLCLLGYVPAETPKKKNADIMDSFASEDAMVVGVTAGGTKYERRFYRAKSGQVSQKYRINGGSWNTTAKEFAVAISKVPMPLDLSIFLGMSDQKKIDHLFELYPPKAGVADLNRKIEKLADEIKFNQKEMRENDALVASLEKKISDMEMPPGTLAETRQEIERVTAGYKLCRDNLVRAKERERGQKPANGSDGSDAQKDPADDHHEYKSNNLPEHHDVGPVPQSAPDDKRPALSDFAPGMSPVANRVANELKAMARESIEDMMAIAKSVNALAVVMKGKVHLKRFQPGTSNQE